MVHDHCSALIYVTLKDHPNMNDHFRSLKSLHQNVVQSSNWGFMSFLIARVILGETHSIVTCGSGTHTEVAAYDYKPNLLNTRPSWTTPNVEGSIYK